MASQPPERDRPQHTGSASPDPSGPGLAQEATGMPRWVKVSGVVALVAVVLIVVILLTGHGPGRHHG